MIGLALSPQCRNHAAMSRFWLFLLVNISFIHARYIRLPTVNCTESSPIGTPISQFLHILPSSNWEFTFLTQTSIKSYFLLDNLKGIITIQRLLDREHLCRLALCSCSGECLIKLEINAISDTSTHILSLPIRIFDENDNYCYFAHEIVYLNLSENIRIDTRVILPIAYDPDLSPNNVQSYYFVANNHSEFRLDNQLTPSLIVVQQLDRERCDRYQFTFCAYEGVSEQQRSCCTTIIVKVTDINDNAARFEHNQRFPLIVNVSELTPIDSELIQVKAVDPDEGLNGQIQYSFSKWTLADKTIDDMFSVNTDNGAIVLLKPLDYEKRIKYELQIQAKDLGANAIPSYATVIIQIIDENDCGPEIFLFSPADIQLLNNSLIYAHENIAVNKPILYLTVSDRDSGENGRISVELLSSHPFVKLQKINNNTFMIATNILFDREQIPSYSFTLIIYDHGQPSNSLLNTFEFHLIDVNDCWPYFDPSTNYSFSIDENNQENFVLHTIRTFDPDENDLVTLHLQFRSDEDRNRFTLNNENQLVITQSLDYETHSSYQFNLTAEDSVGHHTSIPIYIHLHDLNDNPVRFPTNFTRLIISDHQPPGTLLGHIQAEDKDSNAQITYRIRPKSMENFFELKPNGTLWTRRKFNRNEISQLQLQIVANDSLHTDLLRIQVLIHHQPVLTTQSPSCFTFQTDELVRIQLQASTNVSFSFRNPSSDLLLFPNGTLIAKGRLARYSFDLYLHDGNSSSIFSTFILLIQSECQTNTFSRIHLTILIISSSICVIIILLICSFFEKRKSSTQKTDPTPPSFSSSLDETLFFSAASPQLTAMTIVSSSSSTQQQTHHSCSLSSSASSTYIKMSRSFEDEMI